MGDTVRVGQRIKEGEKNRLQNFEGVVISVRGQGDEKSFTVRRIAAGGIGVEKVFPGDMPSLQKIKVIKSGKVRRSKLYYLRGRTGKLALKIRGKEEKPKVKGQLGTTRRRRGPKTSSK